MSPRIWSAAVVSAAALLGLAACSTTAAVTGGGDLNSVSPSPSAPSSAPSAAPSVAPTAATHKPSPKPTGVRAKPRTPLPGGWTDLGDASVTLPSWGSGLDTACPHGSVTLTNGWFPPASDFDRQDGIGAAVALDLDGDGQAELVVRFDCHAGDPGVSQVVGFAHTASGGIRTLGIVVGPGNGGPSEITDLGTHGSTVTVDVNNLAGSAGAAVQDFITQTRGYAWNGSAFHQTTGSTSFTTDAQITGTGGDMEFTPPSSGEMLGTMTVTVKNVGTTTVDSISVVAAVGDTQLETMDTPTCRHTDVLETCDIGTLTPGQSFSVGLRFNLSTANKSIFNDNGGVSGGDFVLQIRIGDQKTAKDPTFGKATFS